MNRTLTIEHIVMAATPDGDDNYPGFQGYTFRRLQARVNDNNPDDEPACEAKFRSMLRAAVKTGRVAFHVYRHGNAKLYFAVNRERQLAEQAQVDSLARVLGGRPVTGGVMFTLEQVQDLARRLGVGDHHEL